MSNTTQIVTEALKKISLSQSKLKVKTSKYLKMIDYFNLKFTNADIRLLYVGNQQYAFGLLYCCGNKSNFDGALRKSSYYSASLLLDLLEKHSQQQDFINVLTDLDDEDYKKMQLSTHILSDKKNDKKLIAYKIVSIILQKRPHFDISNILEGKRIQDEFNDWYSKIKVIVQEQKKIESTWSDAKEVPIENLNLQRSQNKELKKYQNIKIKANQDTGYYINTFYNPFAINKRTTKSSKKREAANHKKDVQIDLCVIVDEEQIAQLVKNVKNLDQIIYKIHLDSKDFDPIVFMQIINPKLSKQSIEDLNSLNTQFNKSIIYNYIDDYFVINNNVTKLQRDFVQKESLKANKQKDSKMIEDNIKAKTTVILNNLSRISQVLNKMRQNQINLKLVIDLLSRSQSILQFPQFIKQMISQKDFIKILDKYNQQKAQITYFQQFQFFLGFQKNIAQQMENVQKVLLDEIPKQLSNSDELTILVNCLVQIGDEKTLNNLIQQCSKFLIQQTTELINSKIDKDQILRIDQISGNSIFEFIKDGRNQQKKVSCNINFIEQFIKYEFIPQLDNLKVVISNIEKKIKFSEIIQTQVKLIEEPFVEYLLQLEQNWPKQLNIDMITKFNLDIYGLNRILKLLENLFGFMNQYRKQIEVIENMLLNDKFKLVIIPRISYQFSYPKRDIFGIRLSDYIYSIINGVKESSKDKNLTGSQVAHLIKLGLDHIQSFLNQQQDQLLYFHNLKVFAKSLKDIAKDIFQETQQKIIFKEFQDELIIKVGQNLTQLYQVVLQQFLKLLEFNLPQTMDICPRPYIIEWLIQLNEICEQLAQLNKDQQLLDYIISHLIQILFKQTEIIVQKKDKSKLLQQLNGEVNIFHLMTTQLQSNNTVDQFQRLKDKLREYNQIDFDDVSDWSQQWKKRMGYNFKALYGY